MESRISVYVITAGVWHHQRCIFCGLITCNCFAINSMLQQVADSIHGFAVIKIAQIGVSLFDISRINEGIGGWERESFGVAKMSLST